MKIKLNDIDIYTPENEKCRKCGAKIHVVYGKNNDGLCSCCGDRCVLCLGMKNTNDSNRCNNCENIHVS